MSRYLIEIEADDDVSDRIEVELNSHEAAQAYVVDLACDRLRSQADAGRPLIVRSTIRDEKGEILDTLFSVADFAN